VPKANFVTSQVRSATKAILFRLGHYHRRLSRRDFDGVVVLSYHGVSEAKKPREPISFPLLHFAEAEFDAHCRFLRETCNPISLGQWAEAANGGKPLPRRPVLLTFDDGYRSILTVAHGILSRYGIPAVAFVSTQPIEHAELFWFDAVYRAQGEDAVESMKTMPFDDWLVRTRAALVQADATDLNSPLSVDQVRDLARSGLVEIGAHTMSHPILPQADVAVQVREIGESKLKLESWLGKPVRAFAYPNGDFNTETMKLVRQAGFMCAFTATEGYAPADSLSFAIPRFMMLSVVDVAELAHRLTYSWSSRRLVRTGTLTPERLGLPSRVRQLRPTRR
jgi:peptidoglycan/xylan/chitin deacetylase (PgdA/CDA1 family)